MWKIASAAVFAACFGVSGGVQAADLSLKDTPVAGYAPALQWPSFYVGGHLGGAFGNTDITDVFNYNGDPRADNSVSSTGLITGAQLGYNLQSGKFVYGIEADLGYLNLSGDKTAALPNPTGSKSNDISATYTTSGGLYGDLTGRLGYASGNSLFYVKGGVALLNAELDADYTGANCSTTSSCYSNGKKVNVAKNPSKFGFDNSDTLVGWTLGVGLEYALSSSWSVKLEYQHFDFGSLSYEYSGTYKFTDSSCCIPSKLNGKVDADITADAVMVGLNYQFSLGGN